MAKVVRTPVGEVDERSELAQEIEHKPDGTRKIKMPNKLDALTLDARLCGELDAAPRISVGLRLEVIAGRAESQPEKLAQAVEIEPTTEDLAD